MFWNDILKWNISESRNDLDELHIVLKNREHVDLKCLGKKKIKRWFSQFVDDEKTKRSFMNSIFNAVFLTTGICKEIYIRYNDERKQGFMKTIKDFLDFTNLSKEWKSALLVLVVSSLLYSSFYTLVMRILFMMNNSVLYYMALYLIVVFSGVVYMMILMNF